VARRGAFLREAMRRYDIFHFNFGQTLLQVRQLGRVMDELPLLRRSGKTILVTFQGCDVRPFANCFCRNRACAATTRYRAPAAARLLYYADRSFYLNPDLGPLLPGAEFLPYANVDPRAVEPSPPSARSGELVVVHAPTDPAVKGTRHLVEAVRELRERGVALRLELLEGLSRQQVLERMATADLVVDQLLLGWYGGVAVEAMALAKPVICFIDERRNPFGSDLPILRATPATLVEVLRRAVGDRDTLLAAGVAARRFVESEHDPREIARRVLEGVVDLPRPVSRAAAPAR
jgi:hypothetical protein